MNGSLGPRLTVPASSQLRTPRLLLRQWRPGDDVVMGQINSDPEVTRYLNRPGGPMATSAFLQGAIAHWETYGFGFWAVQSLAPQDAGALLGFIGMAHPTFLPQLASRVEIGWRLSRRVWGRGLATEGAVAARDHAVNVVGLDELISIIHPENGRSRRVATKLGMTLEQRVYHAGLDRDVDVWALAAR
jgi:RimJ/RimL family protein N-acetyltransferase